MPSFTPRWVRSVIVLGVLIAAAAPAVAQPPPPPPPPPNGPNKPPRNKPRPPEPIYSGNEAALTPPAPSSYIITRMAPVIIDRAGDFFQHATCLPGEQLLGGGYFSGASSPHPNVVSVHANYPSSDTTWTAHFHSAQAPEATSPRPDNPPFRDVVINAALLFCKCGSDRVDINLWNVRRAQIHCLTCGHEVGSIAISEFEPMKLMTAALVANRFLALC